MVTCPLGVPASREREKPPTEAGIQERVDTVGAYVTAGAGTAYVTAGAGAAFDRLALARCTPPLALAQRARLELAPRRIRLVLARSGCPQRTKIASPRKPLPLTTKRPDTTSAALKFPVPNLFRPTAEGGREQSGRRRTLLKNDIVRGTTAEGHQAILLSRVTWQSPTQSCRPQQTEGVPRQTLCSRLTKSSAPTSGRRRTRTLQGRWT